jgi:hypothetical protein
MTGRSIGLATAVATSSYRSVERSFYLPQAAWPTRYQRTITLNGTPSIHATR